MDTLLIITPKPSVLLAAVGDEGVLYDEESETYFGLNAVAMRVWQLAVEGRALREIRTAIHGEFDVDHDRLDSDLDALVRQLVENGLCVTASAPTP